MYYLCVKFTQGNDKIIMAEKSKYTYDYPRPAVTTDCVIFGYDGKQLKILLIERGIEPFKGRWAFPGGFLNMNEDAETGAKRELMEETRLRDAYIEQFHTFSDVNRDPRGRVITISYYALVKMQDVNGGDDAAQAQWFALNEIPPLAFDHDRILRMAMSRLKEKIHFEPIGLELMPEIFTMPELQNLYECILEIHFDRRNFANKILKLGILEDIGDRPSAAGNNMPIKYKFNKEQYNNLKSKRFKLEF